MNALLATVAGWFLTAGIVAIWLGKTIGAAAKVAERRMILIPDTADEFLEVTR